MGTPASARTRRSARRWRRAEGDERRLLVWAVALLALAVVATVVETTDGHFAKADRTYVITTTGADKKSVRGLTESHATFEAAKKHTDKGVVWLAINSSGPGLQGNELSANTDAAVAYCLDHPHWRLGLQTHKMIGIR